MVLSIDVISFILLCCGLCICAICLSYCRKDFNPRKKGFIKHQIKGERCTVMDVTMDEKKYLGMLHGIFEGGGVNSIPLVRLKLSSHFGGDSLSPLNHIHRTLLNFLPLFQFCDLSLRLGNILLGHVGLIGLEPCPLGLQVFDHP